MNANLDLMTLTTPATPVQPGEALLALEAGLQDRTVRVGVLGLGYVGTPLAVHLAEAGWAVTGFDPDAGRVGALIAGRSPVQDVEDARVAEVREAGLLGASTDIEALRGCGVFILCVPTPLDRQKQPDMTFVEAAALNVRDVIAPGAIVVLESTTYPGTTDTFLREIFEDGTGLVVGRDILLAFSPERVDPGNGKFQTGNIPKLVGGVGEMASRLAGGFYQSFLPEVHVVSSARVAEMAKLHENTFRSVNIALVNELTLICEGMGIPVWEVIDAAATKPFGFMKFTPGPGVGGHCISLDPHYLAFVAREAGVQPRFVMLADDINSRMPQVVARRVQGLLNDQAKAVKGSRILALGVAYKAGVDDARESPALHVIEELEKLGAEVVWADPFISELPHHGPTLKAQKVDLDEAMQPAAEIFDFAVLLTDHAAFLSPAFVADLPPTLDTRGCLPVMPHITRL